MSTPRSTKLRVSYRDEHYHAEVYDTMIIPDGFEHESSIVNKVLYFVENFLQAQGLQFDVTYTHRTEKEDVLIALESLRPYGDADTNLSVDFIEKYILKQSDTP